MRSSAASVVCRRSIVARSSWIARRSPSVNAASSALTIDCCRPSASRSRLELPHDHPYLGGIDTSMSIDASTHSLFGVSKAAADLPGVGSLLAPLRKAA